MNSSQIQSSDSASQDKVDFQRFQGIWNNIKKAKQSSAQSHGYQRQSSNRKSIISVKKAIQQQEQKNIQTRLVLTQKQLKKAKQNTNLLLKKLSQAEEQIQYLEYQLEKEIKQKSQILEEAQQLKTNYVRRQRQKSSQLQKSTIRQHQSESELQRLTRKVQFKERQLDKLSLKIKSLEHTVKNQQNQLMLLKGNAQLFQKKIQETQRSLFLNEDGPNPNMKGSQILQLEEAYNTIERLTILLRNTQEFKTFTLAIEDFKNEHFLRNIKNRLKKNELIQKIPALRKLCSCMDIKIDQKLLWTPLLCYKKLLQIKIRYGSLTEQCIEQLLFELNKIYLSREENRIKTIKQMYQNKIAELKKKNEMRYDEMVARKQIQRLKKQIQTQKYSKNKHNKNPQLSDNIQVLKAIGQYEDQLRLKQKQVSLLKERIQLMQTQNNSYDKILYLEGTLWVLDKVLLQIQASNQDYQMFESKFRERAKQQMTEQDWMNNFKYFFQNITEIQNNFVEKLLSMKQSTVKRMGSQKQNEKDSTFYLQKDNSFGT